MAEYIFTDHPSDSERVRLEMIEAALDPWCRELLERCSLRAGERCLEVGPGAGGMLRWLAERTRPGGSVTGVDRNTAHLPADLDSSIRIVQGELSEFEGGPFDVVYGRYVLIHNPDAASLLDRLLGFLVPGGRLVLVEPDFTAAEWTGGPYAEGGTRVSRAIAAMFRNRGLDPAFGKRLAELVKSRGVEDLRIDSLDHSEAGGGGVAVMMAASARALARAYLETGEASEADLESYLRGCGDSDCVALHYTSVAVTCRRK